MLFKVLLLLALATGPALGSAGIKGAIRSEETKSGNRLVAPIEQQRLAQKTKAPTKTLATSEPKEPELPILQQQQQQRHQEETKVRYEARPQIRDELPSKTAPKLEIQQQQQQEELQQQQQQLDQQQEQWSLDKNEEQAPLVQAPLPSLPIAQQQQVTIEEQQQEKWAVKGAELSAPLGKAEPYAFSYKVDGSSRSESGDSNGVVRGQYTIQGADGSSRVVDYVADHGGFRATINTNEFGTEARSPAGINLKSSQPTAEDITLRLESANKKKEATKGH